MGFKCGILGLSNVGKSTVFNALTATAAAQASNYPFSTIEPNVGEVMVPDPRLDVVLVAGQEDEDGASACRVAVHRDATGHALERAMAFARAVFGAPKIGTTTLDAEVRAGRTKTWESFTVPDDSISCGFTEAVRGVLSHHMVVRGGKIANYHPYPPTPWNASVCDSYGTPGPYEDAVQNTPIFEENPPDNFKGIDIMRAVRSFDPCLPCGVHMYVGGGKTVQKMHVPTGLSGLAG